MHMNIDRKLAQLQCTFPKLTEANQHYVLGLAEGLKRAQKGEVGEGTKDGGKDREGGFMKKALFVFFVLGTLFMGCSNEPEVNYYGSLTVNNSPAGYSFSVAVYPSNILPNTYAEYSSMTTGVIAAGSGASPIKLSWGADGTKSGSYLITVTSGSTRKMVIGNFNSKGEAKIDWNTMNDVPTR